eukprot:1158007-Pelagomonas_calceolata.AAC.12
MAWTCKQCRTPAGCGSCVQRTGGAPHPESTSFDLTILQDPLKATDHAGRAQAGLLILKAPLLT